MPSDQGSRPAVPPLSTHPVREALLRLLEDRGSLTSTQAAQALGGSTGLYSFHLRQLARAGLVEPVPTAGGRARPWRLPVAEQPAVPPTQPAPGDVTTPDDVLATRTGDLDILAKRLEDQSFQHWLDHRSETPPRWQHAEAFSEVLYLEPEELRRLGWAIRTLTAGFSNREHDPATRPPGAAPVAFVTRLFPILRPDGPGGPGPADGPQS